MIELDGLDLVGAVEQTAERLVEATGEQLLRAVGYVGADLFRGQVKQNALAHKKTGMLFDNIIVKRLEEESGETRQVYIVTVRKGSVRGDGAYYARWVEAGHRFVPPNPNRTKKGRRSNWAAHRAAAELEFGNARVPAYPFVRPAYESKKHEAVSLMTQTLAELLARNSTT